MGFPSNDHIRLFVEGKTVESWTCPNPTSIRIVFSTGEVLLLSYHLGYQEVNIHGSDMQIKLVKEVIATPYGVDGSVIQSKESC